MRFKNWLGKYSNLASRIRWVRHARRYLNRRVDQAAESFSTLGKSGYAARRWGASRRWTASAPARSVMRRLDYYAMPGQAEKLEDRTLLAATVTVAGNDLMITGDATVDTIRVALASGGASYEVRDLDGDNITATGFTGDGTPIVTVPKTGIDGITFDLKGGDDQATHSTGTTPDTLTQGLTVIDDDGTDSARLLGQFSTSGGNITVTAESVTLDKGQDAGGGNISVTTDSLSIGQPIAGSGTLTIKPLTASTTIGVGSPVGTPAGTLDLSDSELTNLTDGFSSITIGDTTSGTVTVDSSSFNDPVTIIGGGTIDVIGAVTNVANESISLQGDVINLPNTASDVSTTGAGTVSLTATQNIALSSGSSITSQGGAVTLNSDSDSTNGGRISLDTASITSNGGAIVLGGGADPSANPATGTTVMPIPDGFGVHLVSSTVSAGAGNISIRGTGESSDGVHLDASTVQTTSGTITVVGSGSGATAGFGAVNIGSNGKITTATGSIDITADATAGDSAGLRLSPATTGIIESTGTGTISVTASAVGSTAGIFSTGATNVIGGTSAAGQITLTTDSYDVSAGSIQSSGNLVIQPATPTTAINIGASATDSGLQLATAEITALQNGFSSITIGDAAAGTGAVDVDSSTFADPVTIVGGSIAVTGLAGNGNDVTLTARTAAITDGSGDGSLDVTSNGGKATLNAETGVNVDLDVTVASLNNTSGTVDVSENDGFELELSSLGSSTTTITLPGIDITGAVSGTGSLSLVPATASSTIGIGGGVGTLNVNDTELGNLADGFSSITIGDAAGGTGAVDVDSSTFADPVTIVGGSVTANGLNAGTNAVTLTARTGDIEDGGSGFDITGGAIALNAEAGQIGPGGQYFDLDASVTSVTTDTTNGSNNGNQFLQVGSLSTPGSAALTSIDAGSGTVDLRFGTFTLVDNAIADGTSLVLGDGTLGVTLDVDGATDTFNSLLVKINSSVIGSGTLTAPVTFNSGSTFSPGDSPGLINTGNLVLNSGSMTNIEVDGVAGAGVAVNGHDQIDVTGTAMLDGTLTVDVSDITTGEVSIGNSFTIIQSSGALTGTFSNFADGDVVAKNIGGDAIDLEIDYQSNAVVLTAVSGVRAVDLSVSATTGTEAGTTAITVTATAEDIVAGNQTVNLDITGTGITTGDYTVDDDDGGTAGVQIEILDGATTGTVTFTVVNDRRLEAEETAMLTISTPTAGVSIGTPSTQNITITDNESATVSIATGTDTITEASGASNSANVQATLALTTDGTGTAGSDVTVTAGLAGNADYDNTDASFGTGDFTSTNQNIVIAAVNDQRLEMTTESFASQTVSVTSDGGADVTVSGSSGARQVDVTDNESATVSIATGTDTITEASGASNSANVQATLALTTDGTGTAGSDVTVTAGLAGNADYTNTDASFGTGDFTSTNQNIVITADNDQRLEMTTESFASQTVSVTSDGGADVTVSGSSGARQVDVTDNESATVSIATGTDTITEASGASNSANVQATLALTTDGTGTAGSDVTVTAGLAGNADYDNTDASFGTGDFTSTNQNIVIAAVNDQRLEMTTESFASQTVSVTDAGGADVTVSGSSGARQVDVTDNESATVSIATGTDTITEASGASNSANVQATLALTTDGTGTAGSDVTVTAGLAGNADYDNTDASFGTGDFTSTNQNIVIAAVNDRLVEGTEMFPNQAVSVTDDGGADVSVAGGSGSRQVDITDNDTATVGFQSATSSVGEATSTHEVTAILTIDSDGTGTEELEQSVSVDISDEGTGATATGSGTDYTATTTTVTFASGSATAATETTSGLLSIVNDRRVEGDELIDLAIAINTDNTGGAISVDGAADDHDVTINDNDTVAFAFTSAASNVNEDDVTHNVEVAATLTVDGTGDPGFDRTISVDVVDLGTGTADEGTATNDDYTYSTDTLSFSSADGNGTSFTKDAVLTIREDIVDDNAETINLQLQNLVDGSTTQASITTAGGADLHTVTIDDDDVAMEAEFQAPPGGGDVEVRRNGANLEILVDGVVESSRLAAGVDTLNLDGPGDGSTVTLNIASGTLPGTINFNGGAMDTLTIVGSGSTTVVAYDGTGDFQDGTVTIDGITINFDDVPDNTLNITGTDDLQLDFAGGDTGILFTQVNATTTQVAGSGFTTTTFNNPADSFTVNFTDANDYTATFTSLASGFDPTNGIDLNGGGGNDTVTVTQLGGLTGALDIDLAGGATDALTFGTNTQSLASITAAAETINVNVASLTTTGDQNYTGDIAIGTDVELDGANVNLTGGISGASNLILDGTTDVSGTVGTDIVNLTVETGSLTAGTIDITGDLDADQNVETDTGAIEVDGTADTEGTLIGETGVNIGSTSDLGGDVTAQANDVDLGGSVTLTADVVITGANVNVTGDVDGNFDLTLDGTSDVSGTIGTTVTDLTVQTGSLTAGTIDIDGNLDADQNVETDTGAILVDGNVDSEGTLISETSLEITGTSDLGGDVTTENGGATFTDAATLTASVVVNSSANNGAILFSSTVDMGGFDLDLNAGSGGDVTVTGAVSNGGTLTVVDGDEVVLNVLTLDTLDVQDATTSVALNDTVNADDGVSVNSGGTVSVGASVTANVDGGTDAVSFTAGSSFSQTTGTIDSDGGSVTIDAGTDATIDGSVLTGGGTATVTADNDISFGAAGLLDTESGSTATVNVTADNDSAGGGGISMTDGAVIDAWGGALNLSATDDIAIALLRSSATTTVNSIGGAITDADAGTGTDINRDGSVVLLASGNIGTSADPLETTSDNLEAASTSGSIVIDNTGDLEIGNIGATTGVSTGNALIDISAASTVTVAEAMNSGGGNISLDASTDIIVNANVTSGGGNITLHSDTDSGNDGGVAVTATVNAGGGNIVVGGGADPTMNRAAGTAATGDHGVFLNGGTLQTSGTGDISVLGNATAAGGDGVRVDAGTVSVATGSLSLDGTSDDDDGVDLQSAAQVTAAGGSISITGVSGDDDGIDISSGADVTNTGSGTITLDGTANGDDFDDNAVIIQDAGTTITTVDGLLMVTGLATGAEGDGVEIFDGADVSASGLGGVTLMGTSSAATEDGVNITDSSVSTSSGTLTITGMGGEEGVEINNSPVSTGTGGAINITGTTAADNGIWIDLDSDITATGTGTITLMGTSTGTDGDDNGVLVEGTGTTVSTAGGLLMITGMADEGDGVEIFDDGSVSASGTGAVSIMGTSTGAEDGVKVDGGAVGTNSGMLTINGTGGDDGVEIDSDFSATVSQITSTSGSISITGSTANDDGIRIEDDADVTAGGAGTITLTGDNTGGSTTFAHGVLIIDAGTTITSGSGLITIDGSSASTGDDSDGAVIDAADVSSTSGGITVLGDTTARFGVSMFNAATLATSGAISMTGTSANDDGIKIDNGSQVTATGSGTILLDGTSTGSGSGDHGVQIEDITTLIQTDSGLLDIDGMADNGDGVRLDGGQVQSTTGMITIDGTGGEDGVEIDDADAAGPGAVTSTSGNISITGSSSSDEGVRFEDGADVTTGSTGTITIMGTTTGTDDTDIGVLITDSGTLIEAANGALQITGMSAASAGISVSDGADIATTGSGNLTFTGTASTGEDGVLVTDTGTTVTVDDGDLDINGTGGAGFRGIEIAFGARIESTGTGAGAGTITLDGDNTGANGDGVLIANDNTVITSVDGAILIDGNASGGGRIGVNFNFGAATVSSTGTGTNAATITILGTGGDSAGVLLNGNTGSAATVTSEDGDIQITGTTGDADDRGVEIAFGATIQSTGGGADAADITIMGTHTGVGDAVLIANDNTLITTVDGDIQITGDASGTGSIGVDFNFGMSTVSSTGMGAGAGTITIMGTGGTGPGEGVKVAAAATITSEDGDILINGTAAGDENGVQIEGASTVSSTGAGGNAATITITGSTVGTAIDGVVIDEAGTQVLSDAGAILITGSASDGNGAEVSDSATVMSTGSTIDITSNSPVLVDNATVSGAGNVTLTANEDAGMIAGDNVTITNNATVTSTGADVTVNAGDNIVVDTGSNITATAAGGDITLNSGVGDNDDIGMQTLDATISANTTNGIVTIDLGADTGTGAATDGTAGTITSFELLLLSMNNAAATFTLDNDGHDVSELAANTSGDITFRDDNGLLVDTVGTTMGISTGNGVATGGFVLIDSSNAPGGTIEVNQPIDTTPPATGGPGMIDLSGAVIVDAMITAEGDDVTLRGGAGANADMIINVGLQSGQALNLTAPRDVIINALVETTNAGGTTPDVTITADSDNNGTGGALITADGQIISINDVVIQGSDGVNANFLDENDVAQTGFAVGTQQVQIDSDGAGVVQVDAANDITIEEAGSNTPGNADVVVNGFVRSTGAGSTISIEANEDIFFGVDGDVSRTDAGATGLIHIQSDVATAGSTGGVITMADGAVINGGGHEVEILADGTLTIGEIITTDLVNAASFAANIADADAGAGNDITAGSLAISAETGVGSDADAIETTLGSLSGRTNSGDFHISNTGNLSLNAVGLTTFVQTLLPTEGTEVIGVTIEDTADNNSTADNITITTAGTLFVSGAMDADAGAAQGTGGISNEDGGNIVLTTTGANDLTISGDVEVNDSDATEGDGDGNIDINSGQDVIVNNNISVNVDNEGQIMIDSTRAISISTTNADVTSVDGSIALTANAGGASGNFVGITIDDATITTSTGAVSLTGTGGDAGDNNDGVEIHNGATVESNGAAGTITIMGTGGAGAASNGVLIDDTGTLVDTDGANATVSITGTTAGNHGVELSDAVISTDAAGATITIMGTTTANAATSDGVNINSTNAQVDSNAGAISITGTTAGGGTAGDGVEIAAGVTEAIDANNAATILVTGVGDGTDVGVQIDSPISSATGTVTIRSNDGGSANDDITFGAAGDITSTSGTVTIDAENAGNTADVIMADGSVINAGSGLIDIDADVDILLASLVTTTEVQATAVAGSILDNPDAGDTNVDITAATAALRAETGVGTDADPLETASDATTTTLELAAVTDSGDINVENAGHLVVDTVNGLVGVEIQDSATNDSGGDNITLIANSPLTVNNAVTNNDGGNILLVAEGTAATDDVSLNANVTITGSDATVDGVGNVTIFAGDSILQAATSDVTSDGAGGIDYNADDDFGAGGPSDGSGAGLITMANGAEANTGTGEITMDAFGNITLGGVSTANATATAVNIDSEGGDIVDGGDTHTEITANAAGSRVILDALNGIGDGDPAQAGGATTARIETQIAQLDASVTATGAGTFDINILEADAIDLLDVDTADGSIRVETTNGAILATDVRSDNTDAEANDIVLTSGGAGNDINIVNNGTIPGINAGTANGDVFLNSAGGIFETNTNTNNSITADGLRLVTGNAEGVAAEAGDVTDADDNNLLDTTVNTLEASISGSGLFLVNSQALNIVDLDLTGEGDGATAITSTAGTVRVNNTAGDMTITELINATGQLATLNANAGSINDNAPSDDLTPLNDIVSTSLALRAANGVGTMSNRLEVNTATLAYTVGANGILVTDTAGGLTINDVDTITSSSSAGITEITSATFLTVAHNVSSTGAMIMTAFDTAGVGDDLTVNTGIQVTSNAKITLQAGDNLTLQDRSRVASGGGAGTTNNVVLNVETTVGSLAPGNADATGSTVTLLGSIGTGTPDVTESEVNGGTDSDLVIVYPQDRVGDPTDTMDAINHELILNLAAGNDQYRVHMNGLASASPDNQDIRIEDSTGADDQATVYGTSGADNTINVRNLPVSEVGTAGGEIDNVTTGERITYTGSTSAIVGILERLEVNGGEFQGIVGALDPIDSPDVFNVQPSNDTRILIHGNTPQFGSHIDDFPQVATGDVLNLETFSNRFAIIGKTIITQDALMTNGTTYEGISFRNIESLPLTDPATGPDTQRYDFDDDDDVDIAGTQPSPTQAGYTRVLVNTFYGENGNTFGWVGSSAQQPVFDDDLGAAAITLADFRDLRRDFHKTNGAATFRTDIADGWYLVSVKANKSNDLRVVDATNGDVLTANQTFASGGTFTFVVLAQFGQGLQLTFENNGNTGEQWRIAGLDIRPGNILTMGSPEPGPLEANGATVDFPGDVLAADLTLVTDIDNDRLGQPDIDLFRGFNAAVGDIITIRAGLDINSDDIPDFDLEVLDANGTTALDIDPESDGIQVRVAADGMGIPVWQYGIRRPNTVGTAFVSFETYDGTQTGCLSIDYVAPDVRRFDFNTATSPTQTPVSGDTNTMPDPGADGYIGVLRSDRFADIDMGYGWDSGVGSGDGGDPGGAQAALLRDAHFSTDGGGPRIFSTQIANGTYVVNLTLGQSQGTQVNMDGLIFDGSGLNGIRVYTRTVTVDDGQFDLTLTRLPTSSNWIIHGLELIPAAQQAGVTIDTIDVGAGAMAPTQMADADPAQTDTIAGRAAPDTVLTVASSAGTITSADILSHVDGVQIQVGNDASDGVPGNGLGAYSFTLQRPSGFAQPLFEVFSLDNSGFVSSNTIVTYNTPNAAGGRLFDFNLASATPSTQTGGYINVQPTQVFDTQVGFGWATPIQSVDVGVIAGTTDSDLLRDSHGSGVANTFRVAIPDGTYEVTTTVDFANNLRIRDVIGGGMVSVFARDGQVATGATHVTFNATATGGSGIQLEFSPQGSPSQWRVNALAIRDTPNGTVTIGAPSSTVTGAAGTYALSGLVATSIYTVTLDTGTINDFGGAMDADPAYDGFQITGSTGGNLNVTNTPLGGNATLTVTEVSGESDGTLTNAFTFPTLGQRFDFGTNTTPVEAGFTQVIRGDLFKAETGFGFTTVPSTFLKAGSNLRADGIFAQPHTFRVATGNGMFDVRVYSTSVGNEPGSVQVSLEGGAATTINTAFGADSTTTLTTVNVTDGILDIAFASGLGFPNERGFVQGIDVAPVGNLPGAAPLLAASIGGGADAVTQSEVDAIVDAALVRFAAAGVSDADLDQLRGVEVRVEDIGGAYLGLAGGNSIVIDDDAAGNGWFVDQSPLDDSEFDVADSDTQLSASSGPAAGRTDLLTTVMHELAHSLGYMHDHGDDSLLSEVLDTGTRRTEIDGIFSAQDILDELHEVH